MDSPEIVTLDIAGEIATITLCLTNEGAWTITSVLDALEAAFDEAETNDEVRAICITCAGDYFSFGFDHRILLIGVKQQSFQSNVALVERAHKVINRIEKSKKITISLITGPTERCGAELALATDYRLAVPEAVINFPETRYGLYPALGGTVRTTYLLGRELAKYMIFTGADIPAKDAEKIGFIDKTVPFDQLEKPLKTLAEGRKRYKFRPRIVHPDFANVSALFSEPYIWSFLENRVPATDSSDMAETAERIRRETSLSSAEAIRAANRIIDESAELQFHHALKLELYVLPEIYSTVDAIVGLEALVAGVQPAFAGM